MKNLIGENILHTDKTHLLIIISDRIKCYGTFEVNSSIKDIGIPKIILTHPKLFFNAQIWFRNNCFNVC